AQALLYLQTQADFFPFFPFAAFSSPFLLYHIIHKKATLSGDFFDRLMPAEIFSAGIFLLQCQ
ncbi:MAG: hypothetical protein SOT68_09080, partial [Oscillospiraceae bacterium]|nr:hypothetical protein [Oscillospiraceae bacterium]MDD7278231.1 hypothetical protein [Oscillospiraceae bacterium]MDY2864330.1 hypothetical protein [Oscillospiraceae bacterium]